MKALGSASPITCRSPFRYSGAEGARFVAFAGADASCDAVTSGLRSDRKAAQGVPAERERSTSTGLSISCCYLVENREQGATKEQILAHVWDAQGRKFVDENTIR